MNNERTTFAASTNADCYRQSFADPLVNVDLDFGQTKKCAYQNAGVRSEICGLPRIHICGPR
jgi:hypothetical protein